MKRVTLGRYPDISLSEARKQAAALLDQIASDKRLDKGTTPTVAMVMEDWLERDQKGKRSAADKRRALAKEVLPHIGNLPVDTITRADIRKLLDRVVDRGAPIHANRLLAYLRRMFSWSVERDIIAVSPANGIKPPAPETSRDRTLTETELAAVWKATEEMGYPFGPFFQTLILTGQRRNEVAGMRWSEVGLDKGEWTIPAERSKNGKAHLVHLAAEAAVKLTAVPHNEGSDLVFTTNGRTAISGFSKAKAALDTASGVTGWTIHDLRRTFATITTGELGIEPVVIDKILNHSSGAVTGIAAVYQRHAYMEQRKVAMDRWGNFVSRLSVPT